MSLSELNQLMIARSCPIHFIPLGSSVSITRDSYHSDVATRICLILKEIGLTGEICEESEGSPFFQVIAVKKNILPSVTNPLELRTIKQVQQTPKKSSYSDVIKFKKIFSWPITRRACYDQNGKFYLYNIPSQKRFTYSKLNIPQINCNWNRFITKSIRSSLDQHELEDLELYKTIRIKAAHTKENGEIDSKVYRKYAQILVDRFYELNPGLLSRNRSIHTAVIIQALVIAIKYEEETNTFIGDFAFNLNTGLMEFLTADMIAMEIFFLKSIDYHIANPDYNHTITNKDD